MKTVGIIGGGNMGAAIIAGIRKYFAVCVCEKDSRRRRLLKTRFRVASRDLKDLCAWADVLLIAVKPQDIESVLTSLRPFAIKDKLVISIAAGITTAFIEKRLGRCRVLRAMPNMPALIGEGITAVAKGRYATSSDLRLAQKIFDRVGETVVVKEKLIDAVTAVSGSGPAYVFLFAEQFMQAARSAGLDKPLSRKLVMKTLLGSVQLLSRQNEDAAALRAKVTSKGGTTAAALKIFDKHQTGAIFSKAVAAAKKRAKQLSK